ncbi:MAG: CatB-related O-acetyltransferase [Alphaproteobacteria bacterium]|nr:CatB-related O-acetyltransferase [Alphaproteobacteria bacterium]
MSFFKKVKGLNGRRHLCFLGKCIYSYTSHKKINYKTDIAWAERNKDNTTTRENNFDVNRVIIGKKSYGALAVEIHGNGKEKLIIGDYCSIGPKVHFILESEHSYKNLTTYPLKVRLKQAKVEAKSKGDIVLEDEVWVGLGALINSGVHIGKGAVIAAGSVVVKDVEPYSIVGGNPAKHIKYRFDESIRKKLMLFKLSDLEDKKIIEHIDDFYKELTPENVDEIIKKIQG